MSPISKHGRAFNRLFWFSFWTFLVGEWVLFIMAMLPSFDRLSLHRKNVIVGIAFIVVLGPLVVTGLTKIFLDLKHKLWFKSKIKLNTVTREIIDPAIGDLYEMYFDSCVNRPGIINRIQFYFDSVVPLSILLFRALKLALSNSSLIPSLIDESTEWYSKMVEAAQNLLTEEDKESLEEWDRTMVDGNGKFSTSDWPGWEKYIGLPPWKQKR